MKTKTLGGCPRPFWIVSVVLAVGAGATACGGGGGGGGGGMPLLPLLPSTPPAPAPSPAPAAAPAANRDPVPGSEPLPSLSAPQPGSTAAVGNDSEGIYGSLLNLGFVGADGGVAAKFVVGTLWGSIKVTGLDWTFNPDTLHYFIDASPVTGSGTFVPKKTMKGTYAYGSHASSDFGPFGYAAENALAVSQESVIGKWANTDTSFGISITIEVDDKGVFTGQTAGAQIGTCSISGTITQAQSGTAKNMYGLVLNAAHAATEAKDVCKLNANPNFPYKGFAAIGLAPAGTFDSNGFFRNIMFLIRTSDGATLSAGLRKQP